MDEAAALVRLERLSAPADLRELEERVAQARREKEEAIRSQDFEKAAMLRDAESDFRRELDLGAHPLAQRTERGGSHRRGCGPGGLPLDGGPRHLPHPE